MELCGCVEDVGVREPLLMDDHPELVALATECREVLLEREVETILRRSRLTRERLLRWPGMSRGNNYIKRL